MITIEKFERQDFDRLISWIDDEASLVQFAGPVFRFPLTRDQLETYIAAPDRFAFRIIHTASGQHIGHAEISLLEGNRAKLCRILIGDKKHRGQGLGQRITGLLAAYAFDRLGASAAELNVYDWNTAAIRCYQKTGFKIHDDQKSSLAVKGQRWISLHMSLDKRDWEKVAER